ncbi:hypothetical protein AB0C28_19860 [Nonomuraea sp. NPDC048892]|uniref:hypothetical protein n=1 Tax=Nonomuraea sp. NPDC048892 TaxID=3154624 RepID=UPI0033D3C9DB
MRIPPYGTVAGSRVPQDATTPEMETIHAQWLTRFMATAMLASGMAAGAGGMPAAAADTAKPYLGWQDALGQCGGVWRRYVGTRSYQKPEKHSVKRHTKTETSSTSRTVIYNQSGVRSVKMYDACRSGRVIRSFNHALRAPVDQGERRLLRGALHNHQRSLRPLAERHRQADVASHPPSRRRGSADGAGADGVRRGRRPFSARARPGEYRPAARPDISRVIRMLAISRRIRIFGEMLITGLT